MYFINRDETNYTQALERFKFYSIGTHYRKKGLLYILTSIVRKFEKIKKKNPNNLKKKCS